MNKYKVSFWFGMYNINPFIAPSRVIEIESDIELVEKEVVLEALNFLDIYPKTYATLVQKIN